MMLSRRSLIAGLAASLAAPAIVRADALMPLRGLVIPQLEPRWIQQYAIGTDQLLCRIDFLYGAKLFPTPKRYDVDPSHRPALERYAASYIRQARAMALEKPGTQTHCMFVMPRIEMERDGSFSDAEAARRACPLLV